MKLGHLYALTAACAVVLLGSMMSWVTFRSQFPAGAMNGIDPEQAAMLREAMEHAMREALTITGWKGHVMLFGLTLPNWLVPVTAIGAAGTAWARATDTWDTSPKVTIALSAYGVGQLLVLFIVLLANPGTTSIGGGAVISLLGALGALGVAVWSVLAGDEPHYVATTARRATAVSAPGPTPGYPAPNRPIGSYPAPNLPAGQEDEPSQPTTLGRVQPTMDD